jgi:polysaccharide biosynthesis protein PelF
MKNPSNLSFGLSSSDSADICLIAEGSYPYYSGGVAGWAQELIQFHKERTFHILTLMPPNPDLTPHYLFPPNVIGHTVWIVQDLPSGASARSTPKETWQVIEKTIKGLIQSPVFEDFYPLLSFVRAHQHVLGKRILCESKQSWDYLLKIYQEIIPTGPFKDYFSTIYVLSRCLLSMILPPLPKAKLYHALCTGYAGFLLYRAKQENQAPCLLTEQGIYTNERRIEIAMAEWIREVGSLNLDLEDKKATLKDFWLNAFLSFAHVCYKSSDEIISTYDGNQEIQRSCGADLHKLRTIVHGINPKEYTSLGRKRDSQAPIVAFVGRIVPIKDVKTFIRACGYVHERLPSVKFYALGGTEEDREYFIECQRLVEFLRLEKVFTFFGQVDVKKYYPSIDLVVLTSISEAQPRVMMEAGSMGIPSVVTQVGGCEQLCYGASEESPALGQGGIVTPLANPEATAHAIIRLLTDQDFYKACSESIAARIQTYYRFDQQQEAYKQIYSHYIR